jgi:HAD superfamily hydrolase (TIGR01509 family)
MHHSTGLLKYFSFVLTCEDYSQFKPDPDPYLTAIQRTGCKKEECIAIEDSERGLSSLTAAGLKCIVIPHILIRSGVFTTDHKVLKSIKNLPEEL